MSDSEKRTFPFKAWLRDENRRVYAKGQSGPTEEGHWSEYEIVGETRTSWLGKYGAKFRKDDGFRRDAWTQRIFLSEQAAADFKFLTAHRYRIAEAVKLCADPVVLHAVAAAIGYQEKP